MGHIPLLVSFLTLSLIPGIDFFSVVPFLLIQMNPGINCEEFVTAWCRLTYEIYRLDPTDTERKVEYKSTLNYWLHDYNNIDDANKMHL